MDTDVYIYVTLALQEEISMGKEIEAVDLADTQFAFHTN